MRLNTIGNKTNSSFIFFFSTGTSVLYKCASVPITQDIEHRDPSFFYNSNFELACDNIPATYVLF